MFKNRKGFTLIELLIVIAIIGILAVAFLPTILGAPAKGRDTQRVADLQKIQKILVDYNLREGVYPSTTGGINARLQVATGITWSAEFLQLFGGSMPAQPGPVTWPTGMAGSPTTDEYLYVASPVTGINFALVTRVELFENANADCAGAAAGTIVAPTEATDTTWCYAILSQ